jgi:hypothetical protein
MRCWSAPRLMLNWPNARKDWGWNSPAEFQLENTLQEGVRVNQAATPSGGNILIEAILQELGFAFA